MCQSAAGRPPTFTHCWSVWAENLKVLLGLTAADCAWRSAHSTLWTDDATTGAILLCLSAPDTSYASNGMIPLVVGSLTACQLRVGVATCQAHARSPGSKTSHDAGI